MTNLTDITFAIITTSSTRTLAEDTAGAALAEIILKREGFVKEHLVVKDDVKSIADAIKANLDANIILTCGGTGLSQSDVTPEATKLVCDRDVPGIAEAMRAKSLQITQRAMLSRAVVMQKDGTLVVNLPGSQKAATECFEAIIEQLPHAMAMTAGGGH